MRFYHLLIFFIILFTVSDLKAQDSTTHVIWPKLGKNDTIRVPATNDNGYMIPWLGLQEVVIRGERIWKSDKQRSDYNRLRYNVLKVFPYALYAKQRYEKLERDLANVSDKKEQKRLVRACDDEIKRLFNQEIKELTITQGQILTKLIDREIHKSTYEIIAETKGKFAAFSYQLIARVVGHDLKRTYDAQEDRDIESIIRDSGYYQ